MDNADTLRGAIEALGPDPRIRRYPSELRARIRSYARRSGEPAGALAARLTMAPQTLKRFLEEPSPQLFALAGAPTPSPGLVPRDGPLVVHGPGGLRVEGMELDDVVALFRRLS